MGLFSFFRKNKQDSTSVEGEFSSRAEEESNAVRGRGRRKQGAAPVDPVLPEKKRARRRLVGAIALVLAVIIGLPMILDSEPKPLADDIAIQIPSKDKALAPSAGHPASASSSRVAASAALDKKEEIVEASNLPDAPVALPKQTAPQGTAAVAPASTKPVDAGTTTMTPKAAAKVDKKPEAKPDAKVVTKADPKPYPKPAAHTVEKIDDAARAKAILEGQPEAKAKPAADKKPVRFAVQVAALASQEKINELQGKLKEAGIKSYTQKVATESGDRTRIRVGPFASKEDAEKLRGKLAQIGLNGTLVPLAN